MTTLPCPAAHAAVFAHSRTTADFCAALRRSVRRLGGVPERVVVNRTARIVVSNWHISKVPNGPTEALDNLIKRINRAAFGFRNFADYRIRTVL
ncbi:MAG: transposase [Acidimicrobiia bacterium]|nr:transposase [Acidimicrobiia bacterium]